MERPEEETLLRVAEAISDGKAVDWERENSRHHDLRHELGRLRLIEAVATAHREPALAAPEGGEPDEAPDPAHWGSLRIVERLGRGGFGVVYRAHDPALQRDVALKLGRGAASADDPAERRFLEEARRLARVRHPNVLVVHGAARHDGRIGLWTDLLEGRTLEECLIQHGPFSAHEAALIGVDLCRALAAVHAGGLLHRDVKPSNVMRESGGRIVLMDFGSVDEPSDVLGPDDTREVSGTPLAMAPERLLGEGAGRASDIYGLGVLLYRLVTGGFPIEASTLDEVYEKATQGQWVPLRDRRPDLPATFIHVVEQALSVNPDLRFESAGKMEEALAATLQTPSARGGGARASLRLGGRATWIILTAAATLTIAAGTLLPRWSAAGGFTVDASLFREGAGVEERLDQGGTIAPGDGLYLKIKGPIPLYVYVLNEDDKGHSFTLFPASDMDQQNPLSRDVTHRLPGRLEGIEQHWQVTSRGGREEILIVASRVRLPELEREFAGMARAVPGRPIERPEPVPQAENRIRRGIGGLDAAPTPPLAGVGRRLGAIERMLQAAPNTGKDIWVRRITLENPQP